jgi:hypothetical protein
MKFLIYCHYFYHLHPCPWDLDVLVLSLDWGQFPQASTCAGHLQRPLHPPSFVPGLYKIIIIKAKL